MESFSVFDDIPEIEVKIEDSPHAIGTYVDCGEKLVLKLSRPDEASEKIFEEEVLIDKSDPNLTMTRHPLLPHNLVFCYKQTTEITGGDLDDEIAPKLIYYIYE